MTVSFKNELSTRHENKKENYLNVARFLLGNSPGVWILYADVSVFSVCSIFIGGEVWRMNRFENVGVFTGKNVWIENSLSHLKHDSFDLYHPMVHPDTHPISFTHLSVAYMWVVTLHNLFLYSDPPLPCHPPSFWLRLFSSQTFSRINTPTFSTTTSPDAWAKGGRSQQASRGQRPRWPSRPNQSRSALISRALFGYPDWG